MRKLFCIRAVDSEGEDITKGDVSLSEKGEEQAKTVRRYLPKNMKYAYCSDLQRAVETAKIFNTRGEIVEDSRLREQDFGEATGEGLESYLAKNPKYDLEKNPQNYDIPFPDGESIEDVCNRVESFFNDLAQDMGEDEDAVIVFHVAPLLCVISMMSDKSIVETINRSSELLYGKGEGVIIHMDEEGNLEMTGELNFLSESETLI